ncbi:MAG: hypothetical protein RMK90_04475 [Acetobacteraceae bacterium]|nr:hypothetical protein [Acetobacteraceae bacterium]
MRQVEDGGFAVRLRFAIADGRVVEASPQLEPCRPPRLGAVRDLRCDPNAPQRVWADALQGMRLPGSMTAAGAEAGCARCG